MSAVETGADPIRDKVLQIVAEKTGYPTDMLDLDLDLEADLGVDTVKQAEMFAAVRATYNIPRDENLKLRDFPTLAHVIKFARDRQGGAKAASAEVLVKEVLGRRWNRRSIWLQRLSDERQSHPLSMRPTAYRVEFRLPPCARRFLFAKQRQ